ncbi:MAG: L-lysine 6-transaminase [Candidatus Thermoplasmatota archaeon]|jgi:L-lysine 6-transaminase|nr:L-lysine 6-transaminase [Candidatus Thermoplasmatota archaeon]MCL5789153.1 L-lysine 6-transaminase [Candidatus Thermoplasmatota archaeon]
MITEDFLDADGIKKIISTHMLADGLPLILNLQKSKGMRLYDMETGKSFLDFFGFFASNAVGMNHPDMFEKDFLEDLKWAAITKVTNSDIYTPEMARFVDHFAKIAGPEYMEHYFFIDGGALAVENALKTAFDWKVRKNVKEGVKGEKGTKIIHLKEAFHGRSGYTLSMTNTFDPRKTMYFPKFDWPRITNPKINFPLTEKSVSDVEKLEDKSIAEMEEAFRKNKDDIAAFIMEPIQCEGGDNQFRKEYFERAMDVVHENDSLFIVDEVQTGMGVTGRWWAHQHYGIEPDILAFGKKAQVCGIIAGKKVDEVEDNVFKVSSRINSTWGGNLADMVRSTKILEIMKKYDLVRNAERMGKIIVEFLNEMNEKYPGVVLNPRGKGVLDAIDFKNEKKRDEFFDRMYSKGVVVLKASERTIRLRPPLIVNEDDIEEFSQTVRQVLKEMS